MKRGKVIGIDISPTVIRVAKARGLKNCKVANIFTWKPRQKFDTIALIENNLGIAETPEKTKKLLKKLDALGIKHCLARINRPQTNGKILPCRHL